jgi:copper chaperone
VRDDNGPATGVTATYTVTGMTCGHCVNAVSSEVGGIPGVTGVQVDLEAGSVIVDSAAPIELRLVEAAVGEAGYELVGSPGPTAGDHRD